MQIFCYVALNFLCVFAVLKYCYQFFVVVLTPKFLQDTILIFIVTIDNFMKFTSQQIASISDKFETATPQKIIRWATNTFFENIAMSSSFQTQSVPLLHMVKEICLGMPIFFLDTGMHFQETLAFRDSLQKKWNLNIVNLYPDEKWSQFLLRFGHQLPEINPDFCCYIRKVLPMQKSMEGIDAWITGIRRDQTENRAHAQILEYKRGGLLRIAPLLNWTSEKVAKYNLANNLPRHPLPNSRYPSVGCKPCTRAIQSNERERAGRWDGNGKIECGLHSDVFEKSSIGEDDFKL